MRFQSTRSMNGTSRLVLSLVEGSPSRMSKRGSKCRNLQGPTIFWVVDSGWVDLVEEVLNSGTVNENHVAKMFVLCVFQWYMILLPLFHPQECALVIRWNCSFLLSSLSSMIIYLRTVISCRLSILIINLWFFFWSWIPMKAFMAIGLMNWGSGVYLSSKPLSSLSFPTLSKLHLFFQNVFASAWYMKFLWG